MFALGRTNACFVENDVSVGVELSCANVFQDEAIETVGEYVLPLHRASPIRREYRGTEKTKAEDVLSTPNSSLES